MTPLQNDPQQHQHEAKKRKCRVSRGGKRSPDSESVRQELSKSGLASHLGSQKRDVTSNSGEGAPRRGHQRAPGPGQTGSSVLQNKYRERPIACAVGGIYPRSSVATQPPTGESLGVARISSKKHGWQRSECRVTRHESTANPAPAFKPACPNHGQDLLPSNKLVKTQPLERPEHSEIAKNVENTFRRRFIHSFIHSTAQATSSWDATATRSAHVSW
jgi:hypothetical protein